ncbi:MAG: hypothetical protein ACI9NA_001566 [Gammaproteobacteria bacterium]
MIDEFLLDDLLSPEHLSKHPHELLNAEFLKNVALILSKRAANSTLAALFVNLFS